MEFDQFKFVYINVNYLRTLYNGVWGNGCGTMKIFYKDHSGIISD